MTGIIVLILIGLGIFLYWFGYEVTTGKHKPKPNDKFFPLLGRNIDYVLGMAGIPMAIAMFILAFAVWADLKFLNYVAAVFVVFGVARAYLSPEHYGPSWLRVKKAKRSSGKRRKK